jgi:phospholipase/carboxylesterase
VPLRAHTAPFAWYRRQPNRLDPTRSIARSEASLLSPRGKVIENGMPRFFRRLAEGIFDEEDLIRRTHELADFIEQASVRYAFDRKNLLGVGYSNGANIASSLMPLRPNTLNGILRRVPSRKPRFGLTWVQDNFAARPSTLGKLMSLSDFR